MEDGNKTVENNGNGNDNAEQVQRRPRKYSEAVMASSTTHNKEARDVSWNKDIQKGGE